MRLHVTFNLCDAAVCLPIVVAFALLAWSKVAVSALVHLRSFSLFLVTALGGVENILGIQRNSGSNTERMVALLRLCRPLVATLIAFAKRLANC